MIPIQTQKVENKGLFPDSVLEATINLIPKTIKDTEKEKKLKEIQQYLKIQS